MDINYQTTVDFMRIMARVYRVLSKESAERLFSEETLKKAGEAKNSQDFLNVIKDLNLPELSDRDLRIRGEMPALDRFLNNRELPNNDDIKNRLERIKQVAHGHIRSSFTEDVEDGAMAGAAVGGLVGGLVGGTIGSAAGAVAGGVGGAVGGVINWALGR